MASRGTFREWHKVHRNVTYPLSDLTNAIIYAFSVYTTIGYGNMAADTMGCRIATVIYGVLGIPLFFAFVKEEGNLFRYCFISICSYARRLKRRYLCVTEKEDGSRPPSVSILIERPSDPHIGAQNIRRQRSILRKMSSTSVQSMGMAGTVLQRRIFIAGVSVFIVYLLAVSAIFCVMADWDFFTSFYFLFNSVALIGSVFYCSALINLRILAAFNHDCRFRNKRELALFCRVIVDEINSVKFE